MKELTVTERTEVMARAVKMAKDIHETDGRPQAGVVYGQYGNSYPGPHTILETAKRIFDIIIDNVPENKLSPSDLQKLMNNE